MIRMAAFDIIDSEITFFALNLKRHSMLWAQEWVALIWLEADMAPASDVTSC